MADQTPLLNNITDLKTSLTENKEHYLTAILDSEHREAFKGHVHTLIEDLKWLLDRMSADGP